MKSISEILDYLYSLQSESRMYKFESIHTAAELLGNIHKKIPCVLIAGTNGKSSTACYVASILESAGYTVGRFTSPHLVHYNERISVNNDCIQDDAIIRHTNTIQSIIGDVARHIGFFGFSFLIALSHFVEKKCDIAVLEVGVGGRLDPTNICMPHVSVVASIAGDHKQLLGDTLEEIAHEKAGIIKQTPVVCGVTQEYLWPIFEKNAASIIILDRDIHWEDSAIVTCNQKYAVAPPRSYLTRNMTLAACTVELLTEFTITQKHIEEGLSNAQITGRFDVREKDGVTLILDGCHNDAAISQFFDDMSHYVDDEKYILLTALSTGREPHILEPLTKYAQQVFITQASYKAHDAHELAKALDATAIISPQHAFEAAYAAAKQHSTPLVVAGSLYLIGDIIRLLERF